MLSQILISGLAMGAIYALIALGYAFVWKTMAIVNFAAGEFVTFSAYMWLLGRVAPTRVATYAFVNPVVAVLLGWALADETLDAATLAATAVIVAAVAVAVTARPRLS